MIAQRNAACTETLLPAVTSIVRVHFSCPTASMLMVWDPGASWIMEGVFPTNFPSILISAPIGSDVKVMAPVKATAPGRGLEAGLPCGASTPALGREDTEPTVTAGVDGAAGVTVPLSPLSSLDDPLDDPMYEELTTV